LVIGVVTAFRRSAPQSFRWFAASSALLS
jgi:hypothetical protein